MTMPAPRTPDAGRILVIIGHPREGSLSHSLAQRYMQTLRDNGHQERDIDVIDLAHATPDLHPATQHLRAPGGQTDHLTEQQQQWIDSVQTARHIVVFFPQWWGTYPGVLKGFFDLTFLSGVAFLHDKTIPQALLKGRTARIVMTMDSPRWWNRIMYRNAAETSLKIAIFRYVGIRVTGITRLTPVRTSTDQGRKRWLDTITKQALRDMRALPKPAATPAPQPNAVATK